MARKRMVTRTVEQTTVEVMSLNVTNAEVKILEYVVAGKYSDDTLLKKIKSLYETDELKMVHIEKQECKEVLFGMTEEQFIAMADVLPPRNPSNDETESEE